MSVKTLSSELEGTHRDQQVQPQIGTGANFQVNSPLISINDKEVKILFLFHLT